MPKRKGKITSVRGNPIHHQYFIEGDDGVKYFAHMGDLKANEELLEKPKDPNSVANLEAGDRVEFELNPAGRPHVYHVKKAA